MPPLVCRPGQQFIVSGGEAPGPPHAHVVLPLITWVAPELRERGAGVGGLTNC